MGSIFLLFLNVYMILLASTNYAWGKETDQDIDNFGLKHTCSVNASGINVYQRVKGGEPGSPGDKGIQGLPGYKGDRGEPGERGVKGDKGYPVHGMPGPMGQKGSRGDTGPDGLTGYRGLPGEYGETGSHGNRGNRGWEGPMGPKGKSGKPGNTGEKGDDGVQGDSGECEYLITQPQPDSCKGAAPYISEMEIREEKRFKVKCQYNNSIMSTCLKPSSRSSLYRHENALDVDYADVKELENIAIELESQPFWYSKRILKNASEHLFLKDFYFGYDVSQIQHLQKHSSLVKQTIRYFCKNSVVIPQNKNDIQENALKLLSWKGRLIGPNPSPDSPFHYNIIYDGCKYAKDYWTHTDIELIGVPGRLPLLDFQISDIRTCGCEEQKMYIHLLELCFSG